MSKSSHEASCAAPSRGSNYSTREISRTRASVFLMFAANGFAYASWMSRLPDIKEMLQLSPGQQGIMLLAISAGSIIGLPVAGRVVSRIGAKRSIHAAGAILVPGFILAIAALTFGGTHYWVMPGLLLFGLGTGLWDVTQNLQGAVVEQASGASIMSWFHAAFSGGTVLGALVGAGLVALGIPVSAHLGVVALLLAAVTIVGPALFSARLNGTTQDSGPSSALDHAAAPVSAWTESRTLLIGIMVLAASFAEGTANDWMAIAFVDGHGVDKAMGVVALAVFLSFMTAGRILGTQLLDRYGRVPVLRTMFAAAIVGSLLVVFGNAPLAFAGAAVWGVGASLGFPVGMSAAANDPKKAALRISVVSTIGYGAFLTGPPLLGFLGDHFGILHSLLFVTATAVVAAIVATAAEPPSERWSIDSAR